MNIRTPISNSMVELYSMTRYLRPDLLQKAGLQNFDDWASAFGEVVSQLEIKPAGNGFQMKNRFSKFVNIPELMQMYKEFADIRTPDMVKLPVPKLKGNKINTFVAQPNDFQKAYMKELAARSEAIHNGSVEPTIDNMLKITHEARLLGLDSRCINPNAENSPDSKVNMCIDNIMRIYNETAEQKGIQIVFCDIAVNSDNGKFSVYDAIKSELIKRGFPEHEICFASDAKTDEQRTQMYAKLRAGEKRIILASTSKLGTGANVQDKICAIHHLDIAWKPSDLTQQDGRGIRQGNSFDEVGIYHYLTEETFDTYMLNIITTKQKFISQIMTSKEPARVCEDVDEFTAIDEMDFDSIGTEKTAVFILIRPARNPYKAVVNMFYSQLFERLMYIANFKHNGRLPLLVSCELDEFANCGVIPNFNETLAVVRPHNIRICIVLQGLSQLKAMYEGC